MAALTEVQKEQVRSFLTRIAEFPGLNAVKLDGTPAWSVVRRRKSLSEEIFYGKKRTYSEVIFSAGDPSRGNQRYMTRREWSDEDKPSHSFRAGIRQGDVGLTIEHTGRKEAAPTVLTGPMRAENLEEYDTMLGSFSFAPGFFGVTEVDFQSDPDLLTAAENAIGRIDTLTAAAIKAPIARRPRVSTGE